jgi:hypothetical protein
VKAALFQNGARSHGADPRKLREQLLLRAVHVDRKEIDGEGRRFGGAGVGRCIRLDRRGISDRDCAGGDLRLSGSLRLPKEPDPDTQGDEQEDVALLPRH